MVVAMTTIVTKRDGDIVMLLQSITTKEAVECEEGGLWFSLFAAHFEGLI